MSPLIPGSFRNPKNRVLVMEYTCRHELREVIPEQGNTTVGQTVERLINQVGAGYLPGLDPESIRFRVEE